MANGEAPLLQRHHLDYYVGLAETAARALQQGDEPLARFQQLEREHDNLRAALRWALDAREAALALRLSTALARFWHARGCRTEGRRWLDAALSQRPPGLRRHGSAAGRSAAYGWGAGGVAE